MSKTLIHQSPLGAIQITGVLGIVKPGTPFDVTDDLARSLLAQGDVFALAEPGPTPYRRQKVAELQELLRDRGLDPAGKRDELIAQLEQSDAELASAKPPIPQPGPAGDTSGDLA